MALTEIGAKLTLKDRARFAREARAASDAVGDLGDAAAGTSRGLDRMGRRAERAGDTVGRALGRGTGLALRGLGRLSRGIGGLALSLGKRGLQGGVLAVAIGLPVLTSALLRTATSLEATAQKSKIVFGDSLPIVSKWAEVSAAKMGLTRSEATNLAAGLGDLLIPMGFARDKAARMSTETLNLAGALAQWSGGTRTAAEVADILTAAMLGETDSLKGLGIAISADDIKARLLAQGQSKLTGAALQQAEALAVQQLILEKSTDAQEAYRRGGLKLAGGQARLGAAFRELREEAATRATPFLITGLTWLREKIPAVEAMVKRLAPLFLAAFRMNGATGVVDLVDSLTGSGGKLGDKFRDLKTRAEEAFTVLKNVVLPAVMFQLRRLGRLLTAAAEHSTALGRLAIAFLIFKSVMVGVRLVMIGYNIALGISAALTGNLARATALNAIGFKAYTVALKIGTFAQKAWGLAVRASNVIARAARVGFALMWAAATGPVGLVVIGVAAVAAGLVLLWRNSETFRRIAIGAFKMIGGAVLTVGEALLKGILAPMRGVLRIVASFPNPFQGAAKKATKAIDGVFEGLDGMQKKLDDLGKTETTAVVRLRVIDEQVRRKDLSIAEAGVVGRLANVAQAASDRAAAPAGPTVPAPRRPATTPTLPAQRTAQALGRVPVPAGGDLPRRAINVTSVLQVDGKTLHQSTQQAEEDGRARR